MKVFFLGYPSNVTFTFFFNHNNIFYIKVNCLLYVLLKCFKILTQPIEKKRRPNQNKQTYGISNIQILYFLGETPRSDSNIKSKSSNNKLIHFQQFFVEKIIKLKDNIDPNYVEDPLIRLKEKLEPMKLSFSLKNQESRFSR